MPVIVMDNVTITVTHENPLEDTISVNNCPNIPLSVGDTAIIDEYWKLSVDGELKEVCVTDIKIEEIDIEYVVSERNYYINYTVGHYRGPKLITKEKLPYEDIESYF